MYPEHTATHVEIGGGTRPRPGYLNVDPIHGDIREQAPVGLRYFADNQLRSVYASHVLEHIPSGRLRIQTFNEVWRILEPGGTFEIVVPLLVTMGGRVTWQAIADPTHVSYWCARSFGYFTKEGMIADAEYGINYYWMNHYEERGFEGYCILKKPTNTEPST